MCLYSLVFPEDFFLLRSVVKTASCLYCAVFILFNASFVLFTVSCYLSRLTEEDLTDRVLISTGG